MDILILLLFMAVFYLGPALLKRYTEGKKTQPTLPERLNYEMVNPPLKTKKVAYMVGDPVVQGKMVVEKVHSAPTLAEEQPSWNGKLDQNIITNGVIFAEILQPPRAYRPFIKR